ncbi:MAG TPA: hypothetical protein VJI98_04755 [Candidatus Nanoarchaeia archaeon]|nr:hypothetical protein [Candidatus Nanoarchaeia archaeon]
MSKKLPTTGDRLRAQHQWHARFAQGGFSTMIFPIKEMATPPVKIHWWKNHILSIKFSKRLCHVVPRLLMATFEMVGILLQTFI